MNGGTVFVVGIVGIITYVAYSMSGYDPTVFDMPVDQARTAIAKAVVHVPSVANRGEYSLRGGESTTDHVELIKTTQFSPAYSENGQNRCFARLSSISDTKVKVVADCSNERSETSAIEANMVEIREATFNEFIQSTLRKHAFDDEGVYSKQIGAVLRNRQAMHLEALKISDETQAVQAQ